MKKIFIAALLSIVFCSLQSSETIIQKAANCYKRINEALLNGKLRSKEFIGKTSCGGRLKGYYFPNDTNYCLLIDRICGECACTQTEIYYAQSEVAFVLVSYQTDAKTKLYCPGFEKRPPQRFWFSDGQVVRFQVGNTVFTGDTLDKIQEVNFEEECVQKRIAALPELTR
jgi:hypothetical protein